VMNSDDHFTGVYLKLDLYNNEVHYRDAGGNELVATTTIKKIILFDSAAQRIFNFINGEYINANSHIKGWYELLGEGTASAFKQIRKQINEDKPYGSATVEQSIHTSFLYYTLYNGNFVLIKKFRDIPDVLRDKKDQVTKYIKDNKLAGKSDDDYRSVFDYYNALK